MRAGAYSPNHIGNDAAIFNAAADQLRKRGCEVRVYSEEQFQKADIEEEVILDMCREQESIRKLISLEERGRLVINSGTGITNCTRERMTRMLIGNGIPYPESLIVNTNEDVRGELEKAHFGSCWIKRGDFHAMHKEDVSYCRHAEEAQEVLHEYFYRGIKRAVINRHLVGDLVKFYGVEGTDFFHFLYPTEGEGFSKFGLEARNGVPHYFPFDAAHLKCIADRAASVSGLTVYGGDAIVRADGSILIIDFNDWPSFSPCRRPAAKAIAQRLVKSL